MEKRRRLRLPALAFIWLGPALALASPGPENVAVVVNADSWASMTIANEFVDLRGVPASNLVYVGGLTDFEQLSVEDFREKLLKPVLGVLAKRGVLPQIDCLAYSADLPWRVNVSADMKGRKFPKLITPHGSVNGLTYLYGLVLAKNPGYLGLGINWYARRPLPQLMAEPVPEQLRDKYAEAINLIQDKKWPEAVPLMKEVAAGAPRTPDVHYNLACCLSRDNKWDAAMAALSQAVDAGFFNVSHMRSDDDLKRLHDREDFQALVAELETRDFEILPTHGFRGGYLWSPKGEIVPPPAKPDQGSPANADAKTAGPPPGLKYLLSTTLAVTSGRGNSVAEALTCLNRSAAADGTRPPGTVYYMKNSNVRSRVRQWGFASAIRRLGELGVKAEVAEGVLPTEKADVAGLMAGSAVFDWTRSKSTLLPGALCEHLTSSGGVMLENAGQTPLSEFLRYGAAGASGTVVEPYALQQKFPDPFVHVHYARGCTLAEAFYQSVTGPYQLLIVGDPLCRPWATIPEVSLEGVEPNALVKGTLSLTPKAQMKGDAAIHHFELFVDGRRTHARAPGATIELDTTKLPDGYHELRAAAMTADAIETQGNVVVPMRVGNLGHTLTVTLPDQASAPWGAKLTISATLPGANEIAFIHNMRPLAVIKGAEGTAALDTRLLGLGPVKLQPVGIIVDGEKKTVVTGTPFALEVTAPPPLPPGRLAAGAKLAKGLLLTPAGAETLVIESTRPRDWLSKAGVKDGQSFTLEGLFEVPEEDLYQLQARCSGELTVQVGPLSFSKLSAGRWNYLPVALRPGTHHLLAKGTAKGAPQLNLRLGARGCQSVGADRFRHVAKPAGQEKA